VEIALRPRYQADGGVEQAPVELLDSVLTAGQAVAKAGRRIKVVSLANQDESVLAWDRVTGRTLSAVLGWQDRRAEGLRRELPGCRDGSLTARGWCWISISRTEDGLVTPSHDD
jgi:glycerol kinase